MNEFQELQTAIYKNAIIHGFWDSIVDIHIKIEKLALIVTEVAEAIESVRKGEDNIKSSDKFVLSDAELDLTYMEEELADIVIRTMDFAEHQKIDLWKAINAKHNYNITRPFKHNKKV